jgi:hypothetical protein
MYFQIFLQVLIISAVNCTNTVSWIMMVYGIDWAWLSVYEQFSWCVVHGK